MSDGSAQHCMQPQIALHVGPVAHGYADANVGVHNGCQVVADAKLHTGMSLQPRVQPDWLQALDHSSGVLGHCAVSIFSGLSALRRHEACRYTLLVCDDVALSMLYDRYQHCVHSNTLN